MKTYKYYFISEIVKLEIFFPDITGGQITELQLETNKSLTEVQAQLADI